MRAMRCAAGTPWVGCKRRGNEEAAWEVQAAWERQAGKARRTEHGGVCGRWTNPKQTAYRAARHGGPPRTPIGVSALRPKKESGQPRSGSDDEGDAIAFSTTSRVNVGTKLSMKR